MRYRVLGPLEVTDGLEVVPVGGPKIRALLAVLLLHANEVVSVDRLGDELWGDQAPRSAAKLIQGYVSALRKSLGAAIETRSPGYRLRVQSEDLDRAVFGNLAHEAREAARAGDLARASDLFSRALALSRGVPLSDVQLCGPSSVEVDRLAELQLSVLLDRIDLDLALGRHGEVVGDLDALAVTNPLQERLQGQLMLALYRSGRQADALRVYRETRSRLVDELGLEPSQELQDLELAILRHDRALELAALAPISVAGAEGPGAKVTGPQPPPEPKIHEERKLATILVIELAVEQRDPESAWTARMAAMRAVEREVRRHGGVIEQRVGEHILALFGIPEGQEDDAERAVRAAMSALDAVKDLAKDGPTALSLRAAVDAGDILVADDREGLRQLASPTIGAVERILMAAAPGQILVGQAARAATADLVEYSERQRAASTEPMWEASRQRPSRVGERRPLKLEAGFVGRQAELQLLRHTFELVRSEKRPALVTVLGAAGVGKSRLAHELIKHIGSLTPPVTVRRGRCLAYGNVSYSALTEVLKAECEVAEDDPAEVVSNKIVRRVEQLLGDESAAGSVEALVLATGASSAREHLFDVWRRLLEQVASRGPLVLVVEDLHWADDGLLDFIDHVTDWADGPLLVLTLARPDLLERRPTWGWGKGNATSVMLEPLTAADTETLARELLSARPPPALARELVERTGGNPLFEEEFLRLLVEKGALRPSRAGGWELLSDLAQVQVPRSIRALIAAHLDTLPAEEKHLLQAASVVGRVFWLGAVQHVGRYSTRETRELLWRLRSRDVVVAHESSSFSGEPELAFRHVLIRDVAYDSLPKRQRVDAHLAMARWARDQAAQRSGEISELLATHYVRAFNYLAELGDHDDRRTRLQADAYRWARAAGERALRLWQQREALQWFRQALEAAAGIEVGLDELASLREAYARTCEGVEPYSEVARALEAALALYVELGDAAAAGRMEAWRAFAAFQLGDDNAVLSWSVRALEHLEPQGQSRDLALALIILGSAYRRSGRFDEAEPRLRHGAEIAAVTGDTVVIAQANSSLGKCLQQSGKIEEGLPLLERGLQLAREAGDLPVLLRALLDLSEGHEEATGDYARAEMLMREGLELARRAGHRQQIAWMDSNLADYLVDMGRLEEAEPLALSGLAEARHVGEPRRIALTLPTVSYIALLRGNLREAEQSLEELRGLIRDLSEVYAALWPPLLDGLLAQARGRKTDAARFLRSAALRQVGRTEVWGSINVLIEAVRILAHLGRLGEAAECRRPLADLATRSVPATAFLAWADGLLEPEPGRALAQLQEAASSLARLERRVELGRCLIDCARAENVLGRDAGRTLVDARTTLEACGAVLFLSEIQEFHERP